MQERRVNGLFCNTTDVMLVRYKKKYFYLALVNNSLYGDKEPINFHRNHYDIYNKLHSYLDYRTSQFVISIAGEKEVLGYLKHLFTENHITFHEAGNAKLDCGDPRVPSIVIDMPEIIQAIDLLDEFNFFETARLRSDQFGTLETPVMGIIEDFRKRLLESHTYNNHILYKLYQDSKKEISLILEGMIQKESKLSLIPLELITLIANKIVENNLLRSLTKEEESGIAKYVQWKFRANLISFNLISLKRQIVGNDSLMSRSNLPIEIASKVLFSYLISTIPSEYRRFLPMETASLIQQLLTENPKIRDNPSHQDSQEQIYPKGESPTEVQSNTITSKQQDSWLLLKDSLGMFIHEAILLNTDHSLGVHSPNIILSNVVEAILKSDNPLKTIKDDITIPDKVCKEILYFINKNPWFINKEIMKTDSLLPHISALRSRHSNSEAREKNLETIKLQLEKILPKDANFISSFFTRYDNQQKAALTLYAVLEGKKREDSLDNYREELLIEPLKSIYKNCKDHELTNTAVLHKSDIFSIVH
jgi:hypothetical protein